MVIYIRAYSTAMIQETIFLNTQVNKMHTFTKLASCKNRLAKLLWKIPALAALIADGIHQKPWCLQKAAQVNFPLFYN